MVGRCQATPATESGGRVEVRRHEEVRSGANRSTIDEKPVPHSIPDMRCRDGGGAAPLRTGFHLLG